MPLERQGSFHMSETGSFSQENFTIGKNGITQSPLLQGEVTSLRLDQLQIVRQQLLDPKDAPAKPTVEQGEVAVRVPEEALPEVEETTTPYGLTPEQHAKLKELWYERGHYAS